MKKKFKCLIIGYGSIGKRHAQNFFDLNCEIFIFLRKKNKSLKNENYTFVYNLEKHIIDVDFVVISTDTNFHTKFILICLNHKKNIYLEKPITHKNNDLKKIESHKNFKKIKIQIGCQFRSDPQVSKIKYLIKNNNLGNILTYNSYVGQNLNLWRNNKGIKYYSAYKKRGGGVYWDLIHDIDLAFFLLGDFNIIYSVSKKISNVTYDTDDYCNLIIRYKSKKIFGSIILDMLNPIYNRKISIIMERGSINWDEKSREINLIKLTKNGITKKKYKDKLLRNDIFVRHAKNFLYSLDNKEALICDFKNFKKINLKIDKINKSKS